MQERLRERKIGAKKEFIREIVKEVRVRDKTIQLTYNLPLTCNLVETTSQYKEPVCTFSFRFPEPVRNATPKGGNVPASQRPKADTSRM